MSTLNKGKFNAKTRKYQYQQLSWPDAAVGGPSVGSVRTIGCRTRTASQDETARAALIGQKRGYQPQQPPPHACSYALGTVLADSLNTSTETT